MLYFLLTPSSPNPQIYLAVGLTTIATLATAVLGFGIKRGAEVCEGEVVLKPRGAPTEIGISCVYCGCGLSENANFCPLCGIAVPVCSVCNREIFSGQVFVKCPYCGALSHRDHLLEWVKVKGQCPKCKVRLTVTGLGSRIGREEEVPEQKIVLKVRRIPTPRKPHCIYCGHEVPENAKLCLLCGRVIARCSVCNWYISSRDRFSECPECGVLSHRDHLLVWIKVKGYCPNCKGKLRLPDFV